MNGRRQAYRVVRVQAAIAAAVALGFALGAGAVAGAAALLGGLINVLANLYFVRRVFAAAQAGGSPQQWVRAFYVAEVVKLLMTAALLAAAIALLRLPFVPLFAGFAATLVAFWLALLPWLATAPRKGDAS